MSEEISIRVENRIGRITLQRPKALHALSQTMCDSIIHALQSWEHDPAVCLAMIDHQENTRGFCAGGDIRMLAESGAGDGVEGRAFFRSEYTMNVCVNRFPKPYLALIDGVTMGGGFGISAHGSHRVGTENTLFAMPENGIGLFPDVGGGWFLPRVAGNVGIWLGLTGARLKGTDVAAIGVATHFVPSEKLPALKREVTSGDFSADAEAILNEILDRYARPVPAVSFESEAETIERCFAFDTAEEIVAALKIDDGPWARDQLELLLNNSPESVKVSLRQMRLGRQCKTFEENMRMEYRIAWRKVSSGDFLEGVRAVIIDKDQNPHWLHPRLEEISDAQVQQYFEPLGEHELAV